MAIGDKLFVADKVTLDSVKTKVDTNLDVKVSTLATQTSVNSVSNIAGTTNNNVNTVINNVGSNSDASSSSGSVHAKLKELRSLLVAKPAAMGFLNGTFSTTSTTWTTALNISGAGCLQALRVTYSLATNSSIAGCVRVTLDGTALTDNFGYNITSGTYGYCPEHGEPDIGTSKLEYGANADSNIGAPLFFKNSLKIEIKVPSATTGTVTAGWKGGLY